MVHVRPNDPELEGVDCIKLHSGVFEFDSRAAAVAALKHWCLGNMPFFTAAPASKAGAPTCSLLKESVWMRLSASDAMLGLAATESEEHVQLVRSTCLHTPSGRLTADAPPRGMLPAHEEPPCSGWCSSAAY